MEPTSASTKAISTAGTIDEDDLGVLWTYLSAVNSNITSTRETMLSSAKWRHLAILKPEQSNTASEDACESWCSSGKRLDDLVANIWGFMKNLEGERDQVRRTINSRIRSKLRPLKIVDLPDELLLRIFYYARYDVYDDDELHSGVVDAGQIRSSATDDIKNLRLTCRRFCSTTSHLLLPSLEVDMTNSSSLKRLDEVSRHPTISKGVRVVRVTLNYYSSVQAEDIRIFAEWHGDHWSEAVIDWQRKLTRSSVVGIEKQLFENAMAEVPHTMGWCYQVPQHALENESDSHPSWALLKRAHDKYRRRYNEWTVMRDGAFVSAVISAMARMPAATWLDIRDGSKNTSNSNHLDQILPEDVINPDLLYEKILAPVKSWAGGIQWASELGQLPFETFHELLLAAQGAGIRVMGLDIFTALPPDMPPLMEEEYTQLRSAVKHLKILRFQPKSIRRPSFWEDTLEEQWQPFVRFLSTMLDSSSLKRIDLELGSLYRNKTPNPYPHLVTPSVNMARVLRFRTWPNLRYLSFDGPFHLLDLEQVVIRAPQDLELELSGFLSE